MKQMDQVEPQSSDVRTEPENPKEPEPGKEGGESDGDLNVD
jgi:hypothetical protein